MKAAAPILVPLPVMGLLSPWTHVLPGTGHALRWLREHACGPGTRLGLGPLPTPASAALIQAAMLAGCTTILIQGRLHADERRRQLELIQAQVLAADARHPLHDQVGVLTLPAWDAAIPVDPDLTKAVPATTPALILATSGTASQPRLVRLSHGAIAHAASAGCRRLGITRQDTWLCCLPMDHIGGASIALRSLTSGCRMDCVERFDPAAVTARITAGATIVSMVPTMLHRLMELRRDLRWPATLRCLLIGGGPLSRALIDRCTALGLAPCQTYGLTEAASQVCTLTPDEAASHAGSAGRPLDGMEIRVRDGALWLRGPSLCDGYEIPGGLIDPRDADGWFPTGDCGHLDAEGFLTVLGRHDEVIVSGGENIAPAEVEAVLERHPAVAQAGVYARPDAQWGQVVCAALVARDQPVSDAELDDFMIAHLSRFKRPRQIAWVPLLPMTANGKLQRTRLAEWVDARR